MNTTKPKGDTCISTPRYANIEGWMRISGMGKTFTYEKLAAGELKGVKIGRRTAIDVEHGLAWIASQPPLRSRVTKRAA